jgi:hypothetical protein
MELSDFRIALGKFGIVLSSATTIMMVEQLNASLIHCKGIYILNQILSKKLSN